MSVPSRRVQTHKSELKTKEREVCKMVPSIRALPSVECPEMCRAARLKQVFWHDELRHQSKRSIHCPMLACTAISIELDKAIIFIITSSIVVDLVLLLVKCIRAKLYYQKVQIHKCEIQISFSAASYIC